jgi:hypothetical protein
MALLGQAARSDDPAAERAAHRAAMTVMERSDRYTEGRGSGLR